MDGRRWLGGGHARAEVGGYLFEVVERERQRCEGEQTWVRDTDKKKGHAKR